jgi:AraC-like DNA-binding protein
MMFDTTPHEPVHSVSGFAPACREPAKQRRRTKTVKRGKHKSKRQRLPRPNWRSASTPKTITLQARIRAILSHADEGFTVRELAVELGMSRQLCLYHVKKMAATSQLVMILEPCLESGGLRFRVWNELRMIVNYRIAA